MPLGVGAWVPVGAEQPPRAARTRAAASVVDARTRLPKPATWAADCVGRGDIGCVVRGDICIVVRGDIGILPAAVFAFPEV